MRMNYSLVSQNKVSFMKRFLLSGVLLLVMECAAYCYTNDAFVQVPTMNPELIQLDDPIFVNNGTFDVSVPQFVEGTATVDYQTTGTRTYINYGTISVVPGFDFRTFPASVGQVHMADTFINHANGFGGGVITAVNVFGGANEWADGATDIGGIPINYLVAGLANIIVHATNIVNDGLMTMDSTGLIDLLGEQVNLDHAVFQMTGGGSTIFTDAGGGGFGTNTSLWAVNGIFSPTQARSPVVTNYPTFGARREQMSLTRATPYIVETPLPQGATNGTIFWDVVYVQDSSPSNVSAQVFIDDPAFGELNVQWTGFYRNPLTGSPTTNYFGLSDFPTDRRGQFYFDATVNPENVSEFTFFRSQTPIFTGAPATPGFVPDPFAPTTVTNDFGLFAVLVTPASVGTNQVPGGSPTNLPGRVQLTSSNTLNLANTHIFGANYVSLNAPVNFQGNTNSIIEVPYADLNLGVTNGSLILSNLLVPLLPGFSGTIQAFSGSYLFTGTNGITNDVRVLMVASTLQPDFEAAQNNVKIHAPHDLTIADRLQIINSFSSDTASLTISTNANSSYSLGGELNLSDPNVFYSGVWLPNLQFLTNWGRITTPNQANFAGNLTSAFSSRSGATPLQAFVNHGFIGGLGLFVKANYFENSGLITEAPVGNIDLSIVGAATITNGTMIANEGRISIEGSSVLVSNSVIASGRTLSFTPSCFLSDGYAFTNQFGHITNGTLPLVITNGNSFITGGGVQVLAPPTSGDLLATTITNLAQNSLVSISVWPGQDRGASPSGFAENLALGRMILNSDTNPASFTFTHLPGQNNNALYVDSIEFKGGATNTDFNGNFTAVTILPGMKIYYAQALMNGVSIAEKLNGKNGGGFLWVSNYAGLYSSTNLAYPDGNKHVFNEALVISPNLDSDNDGTVNRDDPTPIPPGWTFDVTNAGPISCGSGTGDPGGPDTNVITGGIQHSPGTLAFPALQPAGSGSVSFLTAQGSYNGLFYETNSVKPSSSGSFTAKLNRQGTFTGKLQLGSHTYSFTKSFDQSGNCTVSISGKNLPTLTLTLQLINNDEIVGQVSGDGWTAQLLALRAVSNASSFGAVKHSLVLSVNADTNSSTTASGDSYGTMTLNKNGNIQWTGVLPDGGKVSEKSVLSKDGVWPLYSSLYGGNGALIGWLQLSNTTSDIGGSTVWVLPAAQNALYPNGLTNELNASGSEITSSVGASQKTLILSGSALSAPITNSVTISGKTGQSGNNTLTLSVDVKNGLFNGSVVDPNSGQKLSFQGALLEKSGIGGGFFLNANKDQGGKAYLAPAN
jgi:hypothetical protein